MIAAKAIPPKSYVSESLFQKEQTAIFEKHWMFVGFKSDLSNHNDFITLKIGKTPIVVQNFKGELYAMLNVCSHRKATLQVEKRGNRALVCPYHCWSYQGNGTLAGVPANHSDFGLTQHDKKALSLKNYC